MGYCFVPQLLVEAFLQGKMYCESVMQAQFQGGPRRLLGVLPDQDVPPQGNIELRRLLRARHLRQRPHRQ